MNFHHDGVTLLRDQSAALRTLECVRIQTFFLSRATWIDSKLLTKRESAKSKKKSVEI